MIDLDKMEALAKAAPSGQWEVWTSNSWRRVMAGNTPAIVPCVQRYDNHPDLSLASGVKEWLEGVTPDTVLALIAEVRALREKNDSYVKALADCRDAVVDEEMNNPYLDGAVGEPLEVPAFVAYAFEWISGMCEHWKANHDNQVARARFLMERGDIPLERVRSWKLMDALFQLEEAVRHDRAMFEGTSDEDNPMGKLVKQALESIDEARK